MRPLVRIGGAPLVVVLSLVPAAVAARGPERRVAVSGEVDTPAPLREARIAYDGMDLERALPLLRAALKLELAPEDRRAALVLLAQTFVGLERHADAVAAFTELLGLDPGFQLAADPSPKVQRAFDEARLARPPSPPPNPTAVAPAVEAVAPETQAPRWVWLAAGSALVVVAVVGILLLRAPDPVDVPYDHGPVRLD